MRDDSYRHKGLRRKLVDSLRKKGITDERVLAAMEAVPRHFFLDSAFADLAYEDKALPIDREQTISQPYTVAFQTQLLNVLKRDRILEIGTGSGYQAAILSKIEARVFTVERQEALYHKAQKLLAELGFSNVRCYYRDGTKGMREFAPYDKIIVTAGALEVPKILLDQLKIGGIMVIPVGTRSQKMLRITKLADDEFQEEDFGDFRFVPFVGGVENDK
ncbi:MAG: protein-L-isoaspartate(D-aspartate) O-methyltransferase [Saprospiraceae bacterium]|jgi:protein-L-isoaspartate(D-aspartate) O-methyltransferase|nr:protein-L-isoaspartate(D-aspartate) O-methyltransferase [Saprospiraceae bacterium]